MNKVHLCDCMEFMKGIPDKYYELAIVDPPYGLQIENSGTWMKAHGVKGWDIKPNKLYFDELKRISKDFIIWGGNYFTEYLPPNNNWIIWHKMNDGVSFSMCEMAYCSIRKNTKIFKLLNNGVVKIHPTQKPIALYKWLLKNYAKPNDKIFDSHVGSGSIRIACHDMGFDFEGCEIDRDYWEAQEERYNQHAQQQDLFSGEDMQKAIYQGAFL